MNERDFEIIAQAKAEQAVVNAVEINRYRTDTITDSVITIFTIEPLDQTAGLLKVRAVGFDAADMITGERIYAYKKVAGVVTVTEIGSGAIHTDAGLTGTDFEAVADSGNINITVTGLDGGDLSWHVEHSLLIVEKIVFL